MSPVIDTVWCHADHAVRPEEMTNFFSFFFSLLFFVTFFVLLPAGFARSEHTDSILERFVVTDVG